MEQWILIYYLTIAPLLFITWLILKMLIIPVKRVFMELTNMIKRK